MKLKAYVLTSGDESEVIFDETPKDAAWQWLGSSSGACDGCDLKVYQSGSGQKKETYATCECHSVEIDRTPHFDQYADAGEIPIEAYWEAGWRWVCEECNKHSHWGSEPCGVGDWRVVNGRALCTECADHEDKNAA